MKRTTANNQIILVILFLLTISCASRMGIGRIHQSPQKFHDQEVTVRGEVVQTIAFPILGVGVYKLADATGEIWVKPAGKMPFKGDHVTVTGMVKVGFTISDKSLGVVIIESEKK